MGNDLIAKSTITKLYEAPSFYETIKTYEEKHSVSYWDFDRVSLKQITNDRLLQLANVYQQIQGKPTFSTGNQEFIEEFQEEVPIMSRNAFNEYMDPTNGYWPIVFDRYSWVEVLSGGTSTGVPTVTRIHMKDAYGASGMNVLNYKLVLHLCQIQRYWDTLLQNRVCLQYGYWYGEKIEFYAGKALNAQGLYSIFSSFQPLAINGSTYSICKQLSYAKEALDISDNIIDKFRQLSVYLTGGEFITDSQKERIREHFPNAIHLSRYASSQAYYNMAFSLPQLEDKWHLVMDNMVFLEVLDDKGRSVEDGKLGEVVITPLNMSFRPILRFRLGDLAYIRYNKNTGRKYIKLMGRADSIIVINSQKIPCSDLLNVMYDKLNTICNISSNRVGQIRRKRDGEFAFVIETSGDPSQISRNDYSILKTSLIERLKAIALSLNLPPGRTVDGFNFVVELVKSGTIERNGIREKVRLFIDENA